MSSSNRGAGLGRSAYATRFSGGHVSSVSLAAYAKINLTLEVLGPRDDGFHEVATIMQTIDLSDTVTLEPAESITLECDRADLRSVDNLVLRAAACSRRSPATPTAPVSSSKRASPCPPAWEAAAATPPRPCWA